MKSKTLRVVNCNDPVTYFSVRSYQARRNSEVFVWVHINLPVYRELTADKEKTTQIISLFEMINNISTFISKQNYKYSFVDTDEALKNHLKIFALQLKNILKTSICVEEEK